MIEDLLKTLTERVFNRRRRVLAGLQGAEKSHFLNESIENIAEIIVYLSFSISFKLVNASDEFCLQKIYEPIRKLTY